MALEMRLEIVRMLELFSTHDALVDLGLVLDCDLSDVLGADVLLVGAVVADLGDVVRVVLLIVVFVLNDFNGGKLCVIEKP